MEKTLEIRWHGRGGQGAKTAALLLADVAFKTGAYVQGFPEYPADDIRCSRAFAICMTVKPACR